MQKTKIEWTDYSSNPLVAYKDGAPDKMGWYCTKISAGCKNCYAEGVNKRFGNGLSFSHANIHIANFILKENELERWKKAKGPAKVFICDMTDLFHANVDTEIIKSIFQAMYVNRHLTFQVLTKRPGRMMDFVQTFYPDLKSIKNIWLGVSVENQTAYYERVGLLKDIPAAVRFISFEPLLGPIELPHGLGNHIHQFIVGGESGPRARPMNSDWAISLLTYAQKEQIPFFFKQWGEWQPVYHRGDGSYLEDDYTVHHWRPGLSSIKVGKHKAGALLEGRCWRQEPRRVGDHTLPLFT